MGRTKNERFQKMVKKNGFITEPVFFVEHISMYTCLYCSSSSNVLVQRD